jgi:predicted membrane metal-binding protein
MSDDDKRAYRQLLLIAVLAIFGILFLVAIGTLGVTYGCFEIYFKGLPIPDACGNGSLGKFVLEFIAIVVGVLGAIRLLGQ